MMRKTTFKISKMDCPSEEQIIRMKLEGLKNIQSLYFDIPQRQLTVHHSGDADPIFQRLDSLNFGTSIIETVEADAFNVTNAENLERKILWQVLAINFFFFVLELITGFVSNSMGLVADSLDMLADSFVYRMALLAVGAALTRKKGVAKASGYLQLMLAIIGFAEVIRRIVGFEQVPVFEMMMGISILALIGNATCLYLLQKSKSKEAHIQASMIFTSNDVVVNLGVILAGALVFITNSKYPDLVIGIIVFALVAKGAFRILKLAK